MLVYKLSYFVCHHYYYFNHSRFNFFKIKNANRNCTRPYITFRLIIIKLNIEKNGVLVAEKNWVVGRRNVIVVIATQYNIKRKVK